MRVLAGETTVVEASLETCQSIGARTLRRLLAWCAGELSGCSAIDLDVARVVTGTLPDNYVLRPMGTRLLRVLVLGEAALAIEKASSQGPVAGRWRFRTLPDGRLAITDTCDTPVRVDLENEVAQLRQIDGELKSGDPQRQYEALPEFRERRSLVHIPAVLPLLDSLAPVEVSAGDRQGRRRSQEGRTPPRRVTSVLGLEARDALEWVTTFLCDEDSPTRYDGREVWTAWWEKLLRTDPFPQGSVAAGPVREIAALPMHQSDPELLLSPDGTSCCIVMTSLETPIEDTRDGIRFILLTAPQAGRFVYTVPLDADGVPHKAIGRAAHAEIGNLPIEVAAGWGERTIGLLWHEMDGRTEGHAAHTVRFLSLSRDGTPRRAPVPLRLSGPEYVAMCPTVDGWLLAYNTAGGRLFEQLLDDQGCPAGRAKPLLDPRQAEVNHDRGLRGLSLVETPSGCAVAFGLDYVGHYGVFLLFSDRQRRVRKLMQLDDGGNAGTAHSPRLATNGRHLCVTWIRGVNIGGDRLFARLYELDGTPRSDAVRVAKYVTSVASVLTATACSDTDGYVLVWCSDEPTPGQVRAARISHTGQLGPAITVYDAKTDIWPIAAALTAQSLKLLVYDRSRWPYRVLLKEVDRGVLTSRSADPSSSLRT